MKNVAFDRAVLSGSRVVEMEQGRFVSTRYFHSLFAELFYFTTLRDLLFFGTSSQTSCRMRRMELADGRCRSADTIHLRAKISSRLVVASEVRDVDRASHFRVFRFLRPDFSSPPTSKFEVHAFALEDRPYHLPIIVIIIHQPRKSSMVSNQTPHLRRLEFAV